MSNTYKNWYLNEERAEKDAAAYGGEVVAVSNGGFDFYYVVPQSAPRFQIAKIVGMPDSSGGGYRCIYKDQFGLLTVIEHVSKYRIDHCLDVSEQLREQYLAGFYTRREETSNKIRIYKEAARLSHALCDVPGQRGHAMRQRIRREIREKLS